MGLGFALAALSAVGADQSATPTPSFLEDGERHFRAALFAPAERSFRETLAYDAQSAPAHLGLAQTLLARHEVDQALGEAEVAVHLSPEWAPVHLALASIRERGGDAAGATEALDRYLRASAADDNPVRRLRARSFRAVLGLAGRGPLRTIESSQAGTIPFEIVQDKLVVKASVNGRVPIDMVLDTGAEHLVLSDRTVEHAGLRRAGGGGASHGPEMTFADSLEVAGVSVRRVPAIVRREPLRVMRNRGGDAFSPVGLGLSVIIDYERRELTVGRRLPFEPADVELPLHVLGLPIVVGASGGEAVSFVIDTGSEVTSVSTDTLARAQVAAEARRIPMHLLDAWGMRQPDAFLVTPGVDLAFGAIRLKEYPVVVRSWPDIQAVHGFEMGGILGHNFLRGYRVTIDLARRVVRFRSQRPDRPGDAGRGKYHGDHSGPGAIPER
ncbi:MAG: aspartyl protease family protein [Acidobacteriota bacterium]